MKVGASNMHTVREVAELFHVPPARVYAMVRERMLAAVRLGRTIRISEDELNRFIRDGGSPPEQG